MNTDIPAFNLHTANLDELSKWLGKTVFPDTADRRIRSKLRHGIRFILGRIEHLPGDTWQEKWVAAGDDNEAYYYAELAHGQKGDPNLARFTRLQLPSAMKVLVRYGIIRPSLYLTLNPSIARSTLPGVEDDHQGDIQRVADGATAIAQMSKQGLARLRHAAAAMIVYTGRPLGDINVDEWVAAERLRRQAEADFKEWKAAVDNTPSGATPPPQPFRAVPLAKTLRLAGAYAGARQAGLLQPRPEEPGLNPLPATLDGALRPAVNLTNILAAHGKDLPPKVRAMIYDVYTIDGGAMDYSTLKHHIGDLNTYFRAIHEIAPGHDTLHLPLPLREQVFNTLSRTNTTIPVRAGEERQALGHLLSRVRMAYRMANSVVMRFELTQHLDTLGGFPWSDATVRRIAKKERARRKSNFNSKVNAQLPHLDGIVQAGYDLTTRADRILDAARATERGGQFTVDGTTWVRAKGSSRPSGAGVPLLSIRKADGTPMSWIDIEAYAYRMVQAYTLTVLLRESGLRIEEVAELEIVNLGLFAVGDTAIPSMTVNPSKVDCGRIVGLTPEALKALNALVRRSRDRFGYDPIVPRSDWHEGTDNTPAPLIFHIVSRRIHIAPTRYHFVGLLNTVIDHYNTHFGPVVPVDRVTPHQMRRLFASDLGRRGVDIMALGKIMGHARTQSTDTYLYMDEGEAFAKILEARNRPYVDALAPRPRRDHAGTVGD